MEKIPNGAQLGAQCFEDGAHSAPFMQKQFLWRDSILLIESSRSLPLVFPAGAEVQKKLDKQN